MKKIYTLPLFILLLTMIGLTIPDASAQNLAANPGFETWTNNLPDGWTTIGPGITVTQEATIVHGGSSSASVDVTTGTQADCDFRQDIDVVSGTQYTLSIWVYHTEGNVAARWYYGTYGNYSDNTITGSWQEFTTTFTASATGSLPIGLRFYDQAGFDGEEIVYLDDFSVTAMADLSAPVWAANYPSIINLDENSFDIAAKLDETSTIYYVVLDGGATEPSVAEVMAGTGAAGAAAIASGSFAGSTVESTASVTGLTTDATYDIYLVAEDDQATPNVQDAVTKISATPSKQPSVIVFADFATALDPFTAVSVIGDQVWGIAAGGGMTYAKISGYSGGNQDNEDWLISPAIDLDATTGNSFQFTTAFNYAGPGLGVFISTDFSGTYDAASIAAASWTDITTSATLSPGTWTWTNSGSIDLSSYSGTVYIAFKYLSNTTDGASTWELADFKVTGFIPAGTDATLSDLTVDGTTITGFDGAKLSYVVNLPAGTTTVPVVGYTLTDANATAVQTDATDLAGDAAARTTTVEVTAQDGTTVLDYTIVFNPILEVANIADLRAATDLTRIYRVTGEAVLTAQDSYRNKKYLEDNSGAIEIDDNPGVITTTYAIGDGITGITGTLENYFGYLELHPTEDPGAATSTGNAVEPQVITVAELNANFDSYASEFVKLEGIGFAQAGGTFANNMQTKAGVAGDSTIIWVHYFNTSLTGMTIPAKADVAGIAIWDHSATKVAPRSGEDLTPYSADATLSDLQVNGTSVTGFDAATKTYSVVLPAGTTDLPTITYTTGDANATVNVVNATSLTGTEAERTATVTVTSQDGSTTTVYTIVLSIDNTGINSQVVTGIRLYPVPAASKLHVAGIRGSQDVKIINLVGSVVKTVTVNSPDAVIDISDLHPGLYLLRAGDQTLRFMKK